MSILTIIVVLVAVGVIMWAVNTWIPMEARIKQILNVVIIIVLVVWLLRVFGIFSMLAGARI